MKHPIGPVHRSEKAQADTAKELRDAVRRLFVAQGALDDSRRPCGTPLSLPHAWALLELLQNGEMTVTTLAARLHIDRTNVSRLCARMESNGEIERGTDPADGRARILRLTERGARLARIVDDSSTAHFRQVIQRLTTPPEPVIDSLQVLALALNPSAPSNQRKSE